MPTPNKNETQSDFVSRCMGSSEAQKDFPDKEQRAAFCYSRYRQHKKKKTEELYHVSDAGNLIIMGHR